MKPITKLFLAVVAIAALAFLLGYSPGDAAGFAFLPMIGMALSGDRITQKKLLGAATYPVKTLTKIYAGSLVAIDGNGYALPAADAAGLKVVGIASSQADNSTGADGAIRVLVEAPVRALFKATSITQGMVGDTMYVVDDETFDDGAGNNGIIAGVLDEYVGAASGWLLVASILKTDLTNVTASAAELNTNDGATAGAAVASKTVVLGAASEISGIRRKVNLAAATQALTAAQSGEKFVGAVDAVFTLPAAAAGTKGVTYEFETGALSAGTGLSISPNAADHVRGNGLTSTDNKDLINTGATDRLGDSVRLYCDGVDGWVIEEIVGTWAKEA